MSAGFAASFIIAFAPQVRQRDDASIVPYKSFAAFITIGKVSPRRDEGIPPYGDNIPFGVYTKKSRAFDSSAFAFYGDFLFYVLLLFFSTHSPHTIQSGVPPIIKWDIAPVRAVKVMINTLVPTAVFSS